ncbi:MAG: O-antigen ligase family protein [Capnocytophaga sp.]|nr:O-antigen ligase family protein [Capnocytophaga sp.]
MATIILAPHIIHAGWTAENAFGNVWKYVVGVYCGTFLLGWIIGNFQKLIPEKFSFQPLIVLSAAVAVTLWPYSHGISSHIFMVMAVLCIGRSLRNKTLEVPGISAFLLLAYSILQFCGLLWSDSLPENTAIFIKPLVMLLMAAVMLFTFRPTRKLTQAFAIITFKAGLLLLTWYTVMYILRITELEKPILSCFVLQKNYMPYWDLLEITTLVHPSFMAWYFLIIGGVGYVAWRQSKTPLLSRVELWLYAVLTLFFVFIFQARLGQLGFFIVAAFIVYFEISNKIILKKRYFAFGFLSVFILLVIYFFDSKSSFFEDAERQRLYNQAVLFVKNNFWGGVGTFGETNVLKANIRGGVEHLHNDFITAFVRYGIGGFLLFGICWGQMFIRTITTSNRKFFFFLIPTFCIMLTDSAFFYGYSVTLSILFLTMLYNPKNENTK